MQEFATELNNTQADMAPAHLVVFNEDASLRDPTATMQHFVQQYEMVHPGDNISIYEEEWLDDPWIRILINGAERLQFNFNHVGDLAVNGIASYIQDLNERAQIAIFFANPAFVNPKPALDNAVDIFVANRSYNAFVDITRYPYVRIVIIGLNNLPFHEVPNG